jgi:hypothetical protein
MKFPQSTSKRSALGRNLVQLLGRPAVAAALLVLALIYTAYMLVGLKSRVAQFDFSVFYVWSLAFRRGLDPYAARLPVLAASLHLGPGDLQLGVLNPSAPDWWRYGLNRYPPAFLLLFEPFTLMRPAGAYWTWIGLNVVLLAIALVVLLRELPWAYAISMAALGLFYHPIKSIFFWAQLQIVILVLLACTLRSLKFRRDAAAGASVAAATLIKLFPVLLAGYLVVARRWKALLWLGLFLALGSLVTFSISGQQLFFGFLSWAWNVAREQRPGAYFPHSWALSGAILASAAVVTWLDKTHASFGFWIAVTILLTPSPATLDYLPLLLIPYSQLASAGYAGRAPQSAIVLGIASYLCGAVLPVILPRAVHSPESALRLMTAIYAASLWLAFLASACLAVLGGESTAYAADS